MKTYLFDFDGTLVDSMPVYATSMLKILDDYGIKYNDDIIKRITPLGITGTAEYYVKLGVPLSVDGIIEIMKRDMLNEYLYNIEAKPNVISTLKALKQGGAELNVLTASPHISLDACLKRLGIFELFSNVWSCDDFATTKSDPAIYKMVAERLGSGISNILFADDNFNALKTAKSVGMTVCGVYDKTSDEYTDEIKELADFYISDFSQLIDG